ncbi:adenosylcobinamide-GDP ribazoletransferase [Shewanella sp. D64]|uniref:adenosylcobinamide-GDP ribazoletransferase n=1 Tax=unclassified Shewanella TaxID=196818 RepID=UPI0022BA1E16|nr:MULTISPECIES: adenosylcobinamide-GDP ribazoletransferase [unclassified Shewanella]MEC4724948.1 adenosylcobinamide-GDP ribazoletransferase [Shewanella sp. D64]MEC4736849.1 adenosylcobinamide-GDP ribazoletransferase [Shewanella sp. E94]WBJ96448.1 adenosylcobinamide-GDP ribazoletransferase [Shewanella sp. MTB7]
MQLWQKQLNLFLIAMGFFTRIPMPTWVKVDADNLNQANRYFGLIGLLVGGISALVFWTCHQFLPASVSIIFAMITSILVTGGFHEDGLADTADGLGGGWSVADKLKIMKDSTIGTYGALALVTSLLLKFVLLSELALYNPDMVVIALIVGHCLSRVLAASIIFSQTYVRDDDTSKSKPLAQNQTLNELLISLVTGVAVLWFSGLSTALPIAVGLVLLRWLIIHFFHRQIGGYTGDTLGASQQVSELSCYLILLGCLL